MDKVSDKTGETESAEEEPKDSQKLNEIQEGESQEKSPSKAEMAEAETVEEAETSTNENTPSPEGEKKTLIEEEGMSEVTT